MSACVSNLHCFSYQLLMLSETSLLGFVNNRLDLQFCPMRLSRTSGTTGRIRWCCGIDRYQNNPYSVSFLLCVSLCQSVDCGAFCRPESRRGVQSITFRWYCGHFGKAKFDLGLHTSRGISRSCGAVPDNQLQIRDQVRIELLTKHLLIEKTNYFVHNACHCHFHQG
jgi:hypothetical protein